AWEPKTSNWQKKLTTRGQQVCQPGSRETPPRPHKFRQGQRWARSSEITKMTATLISTKRSASAQPWKTRRIIAKHCCNFGTASRLISPDLRLAIVITPGGTIRAFGTVWGTDKSIAS